MIFISGHRRRYAHTIFFSLRIIRIMYKSTCIRIHYTYTYIYIHIYFEQVFFLFTIFSSVLHHICTAHRMSSLIEFGIAINYLAKSRTQYFSFRPNRKTSLVGFIAHPHLSRWSSSSPRSLP